ncbi:MAG: methyltransferase domain-containing protein [Verrucomicrobia bacterium]|nr:methyltransferase domain-containing protein [Verrucomicrobiota bacterium]
MSSPDLTAAPHTDPLEIYRYRDGLYAVDLLAAAVVHLDFFTWLAKNPSGKETICRHFEITDRPTDVMLTLFAANGFIESKGGVFHTTELAREHLCADSPWNLAPYYASLKDRPVTHDYLRVLKTDKPASWGGQKDALDWHQAMETEAFARSFTTAMDCRGLYLGQALAKRLDLGASAHLLDIGGGSGIYACALAAQFPKLRATVFDQAPVDRIAAKLIGERGFAGRVGVRAGDFFKDAWPTDGDAHLFSNVLHDWDFPEVRQLLAASFRALRPGGLLIIHDAFINAAKDGPLPVAKYSALLMHSTRGKCYSTAEYEMVAGEAGFTGFNYKPTAADRGVMTARKPA